MVGRMPGNCGNDDRNGSRSEEREGPRQVGSTFDCRRASPELHYRFAPVCHLPRRGVSRTQNQPAKRVLWVTAKHSSGIRDEH